MSTAPMPARQPLLVINSTFFPFGGAGSRRINRLIKYLDRLGRPAVVLTKPRVLNGLHDESLTPPASTRIVRSRSFEPLLSAKPGPVVDAARKLINFALVPDSSILWALAAGSEAVRLAQEIHPAAVLASAPQFGSFILADKIRRVTDTPVILDYRDEWSLDPIKTANAARSAVRAAKLGLERRMELRIARQAAWIIANNEEFERGMIDQLGLDPRRVVVISNGFDPDDFPPAPRPRRHSGRVVFTHFGSVNHETMIPDDFLDAIERAAGRADAEVELRYVGNIFPDLRRRLEIRRPGRLRLVIHGFRPAAEAYRVLAETDLCVLVPKDLPGKERYHNLRLFDYVGARCESLVYGHTDSVDAVVAAGSGIVRVVEKGDVAGLDKFFDDWFAGALGMQPNEDYINGLSYERAAARLESLIAELEPQGG